MSDASTKQSVECPICGDEFDPTVAGGWCTNTECGEWQYTEDSTDSDTTETEDVAAAGAESDDGGFVSPAEDDADSEPVDLFDDSGDADAEEADVADDGAVDDNVEDDEDVADDGAVDDNVEDDEEADDTDEAAEAVDESGDADVADESTEADLAEATEDAAEADAETTEAETAEGASEADVAEDTAEADPAEAAADADPAEVDEDDATEEADEDDAAEEADTIDCPDCGVELDADANFCAECGADVSEVTPGADELDACPGCGTDVEPADNFCVNCGEDLAAHREGGAGEADDAIDAIEASADDDAGVPDSLVLEVEGREIPVDDGDTVGREIRAALTEAGRPDDEAVRIHREHVRFVREQDSFYLLDLGDNPTQLNGQTLRKGDREPVVPGDELELSGVASVTVQAP